MSIAIMSLVWKIEKVTSTQKLVLLALADNANDQGECYPSIAHISRRTCLSDRSVRATVRGLENEGWVRSVARSGTSTMYKLSTTPERRSAPEDCSPRNVVPPAPEPGSAHPGTSFRPPRNDVPPNHHLTVIEPSTNQKMAVAAAPKKPRKKPESIEMPDWLPAEAWETWCRYRGGRKGWTIDAQRLSLRTLTELHDAGNDPVKVIERSIERSWTGLFELPTDEKKSEFAFSGWQRDDSKTLAYARHLGMGDGRAGETYDQLRERIKQKTGARA